MSDGRKEKGLIESAIDTLTGHTDPEETGAEVGADDSQADEPKKSKKKKAKTADSESTLPKFSKFKKG